MKIYEFYELKDISNSNLGDVLIKLGELLRLFPEKDYSLEFDKNPYTKTHTITIRLEHSVNERKYFLKRS